MEQTPEKILILEEECTWFDAVLRLNGKADRADSFCCLSSRGQDLGLSSRQHSAQAF
jgi:hypothetical protein